MFVWGRVSKGLNVKLAAAVAGNLSAESRVRSQAMPSRPPSS